MPVAVTYPGPAPFGTELADITLSALVIGEELTLFWATGGVMTHFVTSTVVATEVATLKAAMDAFAITQGADGIWETLSTTDLTTKVRAAYIDSIGHLFVTSDDGVGSVTTKLWRGDAPAVAQVSRLTPAAVAIGDIFTAAINDKGISVTAVTATPASISALMVAAIAATTIPEWLEVTASVDGDTVKLTANEPGVPFTVVGSSSNGSALDVTVTRFVTGTAGTSAIQSFKIGDAATGGTFTVVFGDQITSALAVGASAATVQTALRALSTIGGTNVSVGSSSDGNDTTYTCTFSGSLGSSPLATMIVTLTTPMPVLRTIQQGAASGVPQNEKQTLTFGDGWDFDGAATGYTYTLTLSGQTTAAIDANATPAFVGGTLNSLSNVDGASVTAAGNVLTVEFVGVDGQAVQAQMTASAFTGANTHTISCPVTHVTVGVLPASDQQDIALTGGPTGGTFTLTFSGQTTSALAFDATAATIDTALEALSNIGAGDVSVGGNPGGPWRVVFTNLMANSGQALMTADGASLTGSGSQTFTVSAVTASSGPSHWDTAANWIPSGVPANGDDVRFEIGNSDCLYGLLQTAVTLASLHVAMSWRAKLGLPRQNPGEYVEYRTCELTAGVTSLIVGIGDGSGPSKVAVNTGAVQTAITVRGSGGSSDSGQPAVLWRGSHASNAATILGGEFGSAPYSDQSAVLATFTQYGGSVFLKHTSISGALNTTGQAFRSYDCTHGGQPLAN